MEQKIHVTFALSMPLRENRALSRIMHEGGRGMIDSEQYYKK